VNSSLRDQISPAIIRRDFRSEKTPSELSGSGLDFSHPLLIAYHFKDSPQIQPTDDKQVGSGNCPSLPVSSLESHTQGVDMDRLTEVVNTHLCVAEAFQMGNKSGEN